MFVFFDAGAESADGKTEDRGLFFSHFRIQSDDSLPEIEKVFLRYGLVNVSDKDKTIKVDLKYSVSDNFTGKKLYAGLRNAYLQPEAADKLIAAQKYLKSVFPHYTLVVLDAARPVTVQKEMWNNSNLSETDRSRYLASPSVGSLHSYGAAVDVTIADGNGTYLDMGTEFDAFDELSFTIHEKSFSKEGKLSQKQLANRQLLRMVMKKAGFSPIETEWWHFNSLSRTQAKANYPLILSNVWKENRFPENSTGVKPKAEKEKKPDIIYRVQIKSSTKALPDNDSSFKGISVKRYKHEGLYKYTVGEYRNLDEAREMKNKMWAMGFTDAFIAAFNHDKRIGIMDAVELMNEQK